MNHVPRQEISDTQRLAVALSALLTMLKMSGGPTGMQLSNINPIAARRAAVEALRLSGIVV